jgi:hypothetical protein
MSSGSGNKRASEAAKSRPIKARITSSSTPGFLKLWEIRCDETSVPCAFQQVRIAEIESSLLIGMSVSHPRLFELQVQFLGSDRAEECLDGP